MLSFAPKPTSSICIFGTRTALFPVSACLVFPSTGTECATREICVACLFYDTKVMLEIQCLPRLDYSVGVPTDMNHKVSVGFCLPSQCDGCDVSITVSSVPEQDGP